MNLPTSDADQTASLVSAPPVRSSSAVALFLIIILGVGLRCISLTEPLVDTHGQRQADVATMARYFAEDSFDPLRPQVNWGGRRGEVESEFPLVPLLAAVLYKLFGPSDAWGRLISVVFSAGAIWAMYRLGASLMSAAAGRAAAFLLAISPAGVFYGRAFMPEAAMLFFGIAGVWMFVRYFQDQTPRALAWASALTGMAWLVKLSAAVTLAPILAAGWIYKRRSLLRDRAFLIGIAIAGLVAAAWYWHASNLFHQTGLTVGLHPPKSYPSSIGKGPWRESISKWDLTLLRDPNFYRTVFEYIFFVHLTPIGFSLAAIGALLWRQPARLVAGLWLLAMVAFILATPLVNRWHDYYQVMIIPVGALAFGWIAAPVFDGAWLKARGGTMTLGVVSVTVALVGLLTFWSSGVLESHFKPRPGAVDAAEAGRALADVTGRDELTIVVDGFGVNSPMLLYFAHRRGWSFDTIALTPDVVQRLYARGARYFMTTRWEDLQRDNPGLTDYLKQFGDVALRESRRDTVVFDLTRRK